MNNINDIKSYETSSSTARKTPASLSIKPIIGAIAILGIGIFIGASIDSKVQSHSIKNSIESPSIIKDTGG